MLNWNNITVGEYQTFMEVLNDTSIDDVDREMLLCSLLSGKTVADIEAMNLGQYHDLKKSISWAFEKPPQVKPRFRWRGYRFIYDIREVNAGRLISFNYFSESKNPAANLHHLAALITKPLFKKYRPENHEQYANDLKDCPYIYVHRSLVFFWELFTRLALATAKEAAKESQEASEILTLLQSNLDGFTISKGLPNTSGVA